MKYLLALSALLLFSSLGFLFSFGEEYFGFRLLLLGSLLGLGISVYQLRDLLFKIDFFKKTKSILLLGFIFVLVGLLNYALIPWQTKWDWTEQKSFTLSAFSQGIVDKLQSELKIYYLHIPGEDFEKQKRFVSKILKKYLDYSSKIKFESVDVYKNKSVAQKFSFRSEKAGLFLEYKDRKDRISGDDELSITNAIYRVTHEPQTIYFSKGHGEKSLQESSEQDLTFLRSELEKLFFNIVEIDLTKTIVIPDYVKVLFVIGPNEPFSEDSIRGIKNFVVAGGKLLLSIDPLKPHQLAQLTSQLGVEFSNTVIADPEGKRLGLTEQLVFSGQSEESVKVLGKINSKNLFMEYLASPLKSKNSESFQVIPLFQTGIVVTRTAIEAASTKATEGKSIVAMLSEHKSGGLSMIFGDSDFISNKMIYQGLNPYVVRSLLGVLTSNQELKAMPPPTAFSNPIVITPLQQAIYFWFFVLPMPFLFLGVAVFLWLRMRWS